MIKHISLLHFLPQWSCLRALCFLTVLFGNSGFGPLRRKLSQKTLTDRNELIWKTVSWEISEDVWTLVWCVTVMSFISFSLSPFLFLFTHYSHGSDTSWHFGKLQVDYHWHTLVNLYKNPTCVWRFHTALKTLRYTKRVNIVQPALLYLGHWTEMFLPSFM